MANYICCYQSVRLRHSTRPFSISTPPSGHEKNLFRGPGNTRNTHSNITVLNRERTANDYEILIFDLTLTFLRCKRRITAFSGRQNTSRTFRLSHRHRPTVYVSRVYVAQSFLAWRP